MMIVRIEQIVIVRVVFTRVVVHICSYVVCNTLKDKFLINEHMIAEFNCTEQYKGLLNVESRGNPMSYFLPAGFLGMLLFYSSASFIAEMYRIF